MNMQPILDTIIETIKRDYKDDIAIFVVMGSHLYHDTHAKSDLDMYFIPKTKHGFELARVFIIDGIGFDLWPISWERIERIAKHEERIGSIVTEGKIVYYGDEDDLKRFNELRDLANDKSNPGYYIYRSRQQTKTIYQDLYFLNQVETLSQTRYFAIQVIYGLTFAIALLNQTPIKRGRGKLLGEILSMTYIPEDFAVNYTTIFDSKDVNEIKNAVNSLVTATQSLIDKSWFQLIDQSFSSEATGFYEELINNYNKIERATQIGDHVTALYAAAEINHEIDDIIAHRGVSLSDLPDMLEAYDPKDLTEFYACSKAHQQKLVDILKRHQININVLKDVNELKSFLDHHKGEK